MSELKIGDKAPNFSMSAAEGDHSNPGAKFFYYFMLNSQNYG